MTLTKGDFKQIKELFDKKIDDRFHEQDKRIDARFTEQDKRIDDAFKKQNKRIDNQLAIQKGDIVDAVRQEIIQFKSDVFSKIDPILKEVVASREEREIVNYNVSLQKDTLESHEKRIKKIETHLIG